MTAIDEIKSRIDIVDLVSESVQLRHSGKNYLGFCPFHPNTRTPAFAVFPESGTWRCFGQCNEGGDIFRFVMKKENCEFPEALRILAEKAGIELKPPSPEEIAVAEEHDTIRALLEEAVVYYRQQLQNTPEGQKALEYLNHRQINNNSIEVFEIGYAPNSWDATIQYFMTKGKSETDLMECGLVTERDSGGYYDRFRHRIIFPIRDERGKIAGFGARVLNPEDLPKFINSPQTPVFDKSNLLYGLSLARKSIRSLDQAVIVEGYLDVIALHQAGFTNAVSPMGTALTESHLNLIKRFSRRIILALDSDAAGTQATLRGLQIARQTLDRTHDPVFDARGLLGYEARLRADIRVTTLPEGMDPDDVVNRNPQEWEQIITRAQPIVVHVMSVLADKMDINDPKIKEEIASQVMPLIQDIPSPLERDTYLQRLARLLKVDERSLIMRLPQRGRRKSARRYADYGVKTPSSGQKRNLLVQVGNYFQESYALGILLRQPDLIFQVDRNLQDNGLQRLLPEDFQHGDHRSILNLLLESINQDIAEPLNFVMNQLSLSLMNTADEVLANTKNLDPNQDRVTLDLKRTILSLRKRNIAQAIDYHKFLMEDAQEEGDLKAIQYQQTMLHLTSSLLKIDKALKQLSI